jgi:uncharacterized protein (DUF2267 family)
LIISFVNQKKGGIMALNFEKYAQEGNSFIKALAKNLGHPDEIGRTGIILRAVLHTIRERITISESLNMISQFPMFLKAIYVDTWEYREKPLGIKRKEEFYAEVEKHQSKYGEQEFNWNMSTEKIIQTVFNTLGKYVSKGEAENIISQLPKELKEIFRESVPH